MRSLKQILIIKLALLAIFFSTNMLGQEERDTSSSQIYILPGAKFLTNFGDEIDNVKLAGNAKFMHEGVYMDCDTAYIYNKTQSVRAVGNIKVNQGDSVFMYGDTLKYFGETKIAYVYGNVRLIENDLTLTTDAISLDLNTNVAKYNTGGKVISKKNDNTLTSKKGYYYSDQKKISFKDSVTLVNEDYTMKADTLDYFEETEIAFFNGNTTITGDSNFIFCENGWYDTKNDRAEFRQNAYLIANKRRLEGDSLYYDRILGYAKAINDITLTDSTNETVVYGDFAEHYEKLNISMVTDDPIVKKWFEEDTLFLKSDTIRVYNDSSNKDSRIQAHYKVRFYKSDVQGVCDSLLYLQKDSMLRLFYDPVVWSDNSQLTGDTIKIQLGEKSLKEVNLIKNAFIIEQVKEIKFKDSLKIEADTILTDYYNQIKGKNVKGVFLKDSIRRVFVDGNGQSIYYTNEPGKPIQALNKIVCSNIIMTFTNNQVSDILFLKKPEGTLFPIEKTTPSERKLDGFEWKGNKPKKVNFIKRKNEPISEAKLLEILYLILNINNK